MLRSSCLTPGRSALKTYASLVSFTSKEGRKPVTAPLPGTPRDSSRKGSHCRKSLITSKGSTPRFWLRPRSVLLRRMSDISKYLLDAIRWVVDGEGVREGHPGVPRGRTLSLAPN